jgi:hypothetical protein
MYPGFRFPVSAYPLTEAHQPRIELWGLEISNGRPMIADECQYPICQYVSSTPQTVICSFSLSLSLSLSHLSIIPFLNVLLPRLHRLRTRTLPLSRPHISTTLSRCSSTENGVSNPPTERPGCCCIVSDEEYPAGNAESAEITQLHQHHWTL